MVYRVSTIQGGAGFLPSTICQSMSVCVYLYLSMCINLPLFMSIYVSLWLIDPEVLCEGSPGEVHKQAIDLMGQVEWVPCRGPWPLPWCFSTTREMVTWKKSENLEPKFWQNVRASSRSQKFCLMVIGHRWHQEISQEILWQFRVPTFALRPAMKCRPGWWLVDGWSPLSSRPPRWFYRRSWGSHKFRADGIGMAVRIQPLIFQMPDNMSKNIYIYI